MTEQFPRGRSLKIVDDNVRRTEGPCASGELTIKCENSNDSTTYLNKPFADSLVDPGEAVDLTVVCGGEGVVDSGETVVNCVEVMSGPFAGSVVDALSSSDLEITGKDVGILC